MPSLFPSQIQTFPQMTNTLVSDMPLIAQYQEAMSRQDLITARQILGQIPNNQTKIITSDYLNTINDTVVAVQQFFKERYSPAYIVSATQPIDQRVGDYWFQVIE